jgi:hypothetical protein
LPYPAAWRLVKGDVGTVTAALRDRAGRYVGYLNLTPRQGAERVSSWAAFRPAHDRDEGDRRVRLMAAGTGLRFRNGKGACVKDSYTTSTGERYVEVACLIDGRRPSVVVGAAPPGRWPSQAATIERAIGGVGSEGGPVVGAPTAKVWPPAAAERARNVSSLLSHAARSRARPPLRRLRVAMLAPPGSRRRVGVAARVAALGMPSDREASAPVKYAANCVGWNRNVVGKPLFILSNQLHGGAMSMRKPAAATLSILALAMTASTASANPSPPTNGGNGAGKSGQCTGPNAERPSSCQSQGGPGNQP